MEWGKSENFIVVDGGDRTHDPKTHNLSTTPFVKLISGVLVRLTTCNWLTNSLPRLSLTTTDCAHNVMEYSSIRYVKNRRKNHTEYEGLKKPAKMEQKTKKNAPRATFNNVDNISRSFYA